VHIFLYDRDNDELSFAAGAWDEPDMSRSAYRAPRKDGLTAQVARSGRPLLVNETRSHPLFVDYGDWRANMEAAGGFPLKVHDRVIGVLNIAFDSPHTFDEHELRLVGLLADQSAIAIENARLYAEQERSAREMTALYETSLDIGGRLELPDVLRSIMIRAVELLGASGAAVWLYRPEDEEREFVVEHGGPEIHVGGRLKIGEGLAGKVFQTGEAITVEDYRRWEGRSQRLDSGVIGGMVGVPLLWGERAMGVLEVDEVEKPRRFTKEEVRLLSLFANQAAVAIQNARLHEETETRRRYLETLQGISSTLRSTLPLSDVLDQIVHGTTEALDYTGAAIALPDLGGERLSLRTVSGGKLVDAALKLAGRSLGSFTLPLTAEDNLIVRAFLTGEFQASSGEPEGLAAGAEPPISPRVARAMEKMMGTKSAVCVPLRSGETTVGVLIAMSPRERLADEERAMLVGLADQGGLAMENARLFEETRRREAQLAALHDVSLEIASELDLTVLLKAVAQGAIDLLGGPRGGLYLYRPEREELETVVHLGSEHDYRGTTLRLGEGACGTAAQAGQPLVVLDYTNWEGRSVKFEDEGTFNVLAVPIRHGDSVLGALHINDPDLERRFDEADIRLATMFANQAAIAIENTRLHQEQHQRAEELTALRETALDITRHLDLDSLLAAVIARATRLLDAPSGDIYLYRPDYDDLQRVASLGMPPELQGRALKVGEGLSGKVFETGEPLAVEDYESWEGRSVQYAGYGFSRALAAPLRYGTRSLGVLVVDRPADAPRFTERDANLLTLFADQAAIAIENAQLLNAVAKHKENLQGLSSRLIDAQEQERKRIAQELHDEMGQALTAMSINLSAIDKQLGAALDPETAQRLAETDSLITRTLEQMRELALDLRPSMLDDLGLLPALRWYVKRYENRTGILVGLEAVGLELRLPEQIETVIYRMVQEALTNVARHARANRVDIRLQRRDSIVQAFIEDDGSGFDPAEVADREAQERGVGLVGMRERIAAVGGSLEIKSHPGKGTRLAIELPLP
jgi:GAF domain-containing protein/anti-sigma regulatory factor (Ser/Thr protein kinase)